MNTLLDSLIK